MLTATFTTHPSRSRSRWTRLESRMLLSFVLKHQDAVHTRGELISLAANYFQRSVRSIRDRMRCLEAPRKQRTSRIYSGQQLWGRFPRYRETAINPAGFHISLPELQEALLDRKPWRMFSTT